MARPQPIGTTKGPGENAHEFTFVTPDPEQRVKYGEYVYYEADIDGERREILARVIQREPLRLYPDAFLGDPNVAPQAVADLLGFGVQGHELFQITASVLGYYQGSLGFINPRIPPRPGEPIYVASDKLLTEVLCRTTQGTMGSVHIGSLLSRSNESVPILLDARGFTSTHLAIIASTGSGKSYLAGVILEELMQPYNRAAVLIVDPHGEYDTLDGIKGHPAFCCDGYQPDVRVFHPGDIKVRVGSLTIGDLRSLLPNLSDRMDHFIGEALHRARRKNNDRWTRQQLVAEIRASSNNGQPVTDPHDDEQMDSTVAALIWRVQSTLNSDIFDDMSSMPLTDLFCPGQCTVLQLNEIPQREQQIIVATLLRRFYQARMETMRERVQRGDENYLPYPGFVLIEEAHNYAPANADVVTTSILKQILAEGRKFGVAVGLISQRPGKLDSDVLSQCMTQCIMRIVNPVDQARVAESVETVGRDLINELPALSRGQVIVAGASVNTPVLVRVRQRTTEHGAEDLNAPEQWLQYFQEHEVERRQRDSARPAYSSRREARNRLDDLF